MKTLAQPLEDQILFTKNGFTDEMCRKQESSEIAYNLRYPAYRSVDSIKVNYQEIFLDKYDEQNNVRTYLIWYEGHPVVGIRSLTWSADYSWMHTDSVVILREDIDQ